MAMLPAQPHLDDAMTKETPIPLPNVLGASLPRGSRAKIGYVHSRSKRCESLYSPLPGARSDNTSQTSHFLTISTDIDVANLSQDVLVYAVEVLIYSTRQLTTLFVSKADSTSFRERGNRIPIRKITTTFLQWLIDNELRNRPSRPLVVSLFGRAQGAYLFPGSAESGKKHVLDDRQLVKWWVKTLDPILTATATDQAMGSRYGYITVPGYHGAELRQFLPKGQTHWKAGNPAQELSSIRRLPEHAPIRCLLPRFPDDPKARFMQDLDDEVGLCEDAGASAVLSPSKRKDGRWKTIHTLDRFWEAMEFRQECMSGRVVGFLWLVINAEQQRSRDVRGSSPSRMAPQENGRDSPFRNTSSRKRTKHQQHKRLKGRIVVRPPRVKGSLNGEARSHRPGGTGLLLSHDGYDQAMSTLLHLDFATADAAAKSTRKWLAEIGAIASTPAGSWILDIWGTDDSTVPSTSSTRPDPVNDLGNMIRKKQKKKRVHNGDDDAIGIVPPTNASEVQTTPVIVNTLGAGLVRKKAKVM